MVVTRKPAPNAAYANPSNASSLPPAAPYPTSPISERRQDHQPDASRISGGNNGAISTEWYNDNNSQHGAESRHIPDPSQLPDSLRIHPPGGISNKPPAVVQPAPSASNNPYLQSEQKSLGGLPGQDGGSAVWTKEDTQMVPAQAPVVLEPRDSSHNAPPSDQLANLSVSDQYSNPWQPVVDQKQQPHPIQPSTIELQDPGKEAWVIPTPEKQLSETQSNSNSSQAPVLVDIANDESPAWDEDGYDDLSSAADKTASHPTQQSRPKYDDDDDHVWDDSIGHNSHEAVLEPHPVAIPEDPAHQAEEWNVVDHQPIAPQQSGVIGFDGVAISDELLNPPLPPRPFEQPPPHPPRPYEQPPQQPPRPVLATTQPSFASVAAQGTPTSATSSSTVQRQRKETYEIKKITWHDVNSPTNPRVSPILVQNANGPCPLLALVNALTLSTPSNVNTALVECLRSREQVSLGLLLDAVFDELMSGRRGDAVQELPDVGDLYSFLVTLHTGMNVNPRFFPPPKSGSKDDIRNSISHIHPSEREDNIPGTFEETREMRLYGTFSIPLIHGWLPTRDSPEYHALWRSAKTYEDAQNLMFHEEELEYKLQREGLSFEEQATLEDISTIKAFFNTAATQLTPHGLEVITNSLSPGSVAILFRNDHFSTLYRHPDTLQLLQLVTDLGYAGHQEVVWESLTDVNGENAEFFSGDFRLVGGGNVQHNQEWNTGVQEQAQSSDVQHPPPMSPNTEQEDHDLALALQLQEEEDARHRSEQARRRREAELSETYIEQQAASRSVPVSTRGGRGGIESRPPIPPRRSGPAAAARQDPAAGMDAPPPTYEQAATDAPYVPPSNHPAHPNAPQRRASAFNAQTQNQGQPGWQGPGQPHRRQGSLTGAGQQGRDRDCVIM
ncbi:hypothetical protein F5884DRAFT_57513 [Xylogone sp. PMI_703]|nr:hypothetical protein F5884DRAFT_57513 [Xylogone sp. PMI_703]